MCANPRLCSPCPALPVVAAVAVAVVVVVLVFCCMEQHHLHSLSDCVSAYVSFRLFVIIFSTVRARHRGHPPLQGI